MVIAINEKFLICAKNNSKQCLMSKIPKEPVKTEILARKRTVIFGESLLITVSFTLTNDENLLQDSENFMKCFIILA